MGTSNQLGSFALQTRDPYPAHVEPQRRHAARSPPCDCVFVIMTVCLTSMLTAAASSTPSSGTAAARSTAIESSLDTLAVTASRALRGCGGRLLAGAWATCMQLDGGHVSRHCMVLLVCQQCRKSMHAGITLVEEGSE